ncbi:MAG: phosphatase PAP2 family protein [Mariprofundaceae bacterium]|nr:phosphatase PAP2 family protein [Mariprofundaceae bacterium]
MIDSFNVSLFKLINGANSVFFDTVIGVVSGLGDGLIVALCCAVLMLFRFRLGMAATVAFLLSGMIAQLLKRLFDLPRPPAVFEDVHLLGSALHSHTFPSGHATSDGVMVLLAFLIWQWRDWRAGLVASLFLLAAYGRIYGGVHFPLDVFAGLLIGMLSMWVCHRWSRLWPVERWNKGDWCWRIVGMIVVIEGAVLGLGYQIQPATAQPLAVVFPLVSLWLVMVFWKQSIQYER